VRWLTVLGALVVLMMLASGGVLHGDLCAGTIGCVGANDAGLRVHSAGTP